jgi:rhamnosyltransferase
VVEVSRKRSVGILVPTFQAEAQVARCLTPLVEAKLGPVLVIDSSSTDATAAVAARLGAQVIVIKQSDFNHGATREWGRQELATDIVVMATQDAYARTPADLHALVAPLLGGHAAMSYGRQLPRPNASLLERFPRQFSYPEEPEVRHASDITALGVRAFFCSNAFAAWDNSALTAVGGFPRILTNEDAVACARLLKAGFRVEYVPAACVQHSHTYGPFQEFKRFFDTGYARTKFAADLEVRGGHGPHGLRYATQLLRSAGANAPDLGRCFAHIAARVAGYRVGAFAESLPRPVRRALSSQPCAWYAGYDEASVASRLRTSPRG